MHRFRQFLSGRNRRLVHLAALVLVMAIAVTILSQAAFAQNVYVITDGDQVLVHTTSTTDPANVLDEAGLSLGTEDTYITLENDGVSEITIQRNQNVTVVDNDQVLETDTYGAATLLAVTPLSEQSCALGGTAVSIPDFTDGKWINRSPAPASVFSLDRIDKELYEM